ncbi:MAG TPA: glucosyl-3-phosphoglycerate synthase [Solirubrobacteraceae bacterium]|jgi:glucosyl-3-phosphoglycerate synthase
MTTADRVERWQRARTFHHAGFPAERLAVERDATVSVCVPAKDCAATIGPIARELVGLVERGAIDEVLVIDAESRDATSEIARSEGARVVEEAALLPEYGPVLGKGDAMWRALTALTGDVVVYVDGDSEDFGAHYACGLAGPIVCDPGAQYVKGFYRRPFRAGETTLAHGGGRVTELTAKPLLRRFWPELAGIRQPLAGELAGRRSLLERLPFATGYAVETAMLLDAYAEVGLRGLAQVDLDVRQNAHQPLAALGPMADAVLGAVARRLEREGRLGAADAEGVAFTERPPMATVQRAAA